MLADSGLPTGSFAHSAGIEAAAQLGLLRNDENEKALQHFIHAAVKSSLQLHVPFVIASFQGDSITFESFNELDRQMHAYMVSNSVACRASLEQGQGLLRVAIKWLQERQDNNGENDENLVLLQDIQDSIVDGNTHGHVAPIFGIVCSSLGLSHDANEACRLLGYCTARDIVSAAVRLNLIGPMAGVALLDSCMTAVEEGIASAKAQQQAVDDTREDENGEASMINSRMIQASTCAPIVETVHPCHEILSVRLFRT
jgi:urease accessory protein